MTVFPSSDVHRIAELEEPHRVERGLLSMGFLGSWQSAGYLLEVFQRRMFLALTIVLLLAVATPAVVAIGKSRQKAHMIRKFVRMAAISTVLVFALQFLAEKIFFVQFSREGSGVLFVFLVSLFLLLEEGSLGEGKQSSSTGNKDG